MWSYFCKNKTYKDICQILKKTWKDAHENVHTEYLWVVEAQVSFFIF